MAIVLFSPFGPTSHVFLNPGIVGWSNASDPTQPPYLLNRDGTPIIALTDMTLVINGIVITIHKGDLIPNPLAGGFSKGVTISDDTLTVTNGFPNQTTQPTNQGAVINPANAAVGSVDDTLAIYWEIKLDKFSGDTGSVGIGVCDITAINDYGSLAANGTGGIIWRPADGSTWGNGTKYVDNMGGNLSLPAASQGDTVGMVVAMAGAGTGMSLAFMGVGGSIAGTDAGAFELNPVGPYGPPFNDFSLPGPLSAALPVVVFGSPGSFGQISVTANFGSGGPSSFLGNPSASQNVILGWPSSAVILPPPNTPFPQFPPPVFPPPRFPPGP